MARVLIEYFKPNPVEPGAFPLGVVAQDDKQIVYRLFQRPRLHLEKFPEFHLEARDEVMQHNVLIPSFRRRLADGRLEVIPVTDPDFLDALAARGDAYFRYGRVWRVEDLDATSAATAIAAMPEEHLDRIAREDTRSTLSELERAVG